MEISHPQDREPTREELQELEKLKAIIERATEDGKLTEVEFASIKDAIRADRKASVEELQLVRKLIDEKIARGELEKF
ncbi:hypothetical protein STA3757_11610 [Stanieria sp. NIES-3757]|nr:hypothetical protein STA3757_11610 [Stanieria sp. NIES-3757]